MARPYRLDEEDCFYHITSRGDDRKPIFKSERDYARFLEYVSVAKDKFKFYLHAYCLMTNHYHLFIETTQANLSRIMQYINTSYAVYYNVKRKRSGHLFQGRFKSIIVQQDAYYAELTRYIHLNPVRAGMRDEPGKYRWSSYNDFVKNKPESGVDIDRVKMYLGMDLRRYAGFVKAAGNEYPNPLKNVYAGFILGKAQFIKDKLSRLGNDIKTRDFAHKRALKNMVAPEEIIKTVANHFNTNPEDIRNTRKKNMTAKKAAIYLLRRKTGLTNSQIGELFGMQSSAVSMAAKGFEKKLESAKDLKRGIEGVSLKFDV